MSQILTTQRLKLSEAILHSVAYGDVFDYPLTPTEIHRFLPLLAVTQAAVNDELPNLVSRGSLEQAGEWYTLAGRAGLAEIRRQRMHNSTRLWQQAHRYARLMANLPFVRMLAVTGSLAMNNVPNSAEADIDFLVVTAPGRLWLCRALLVGVVRLAAQRGIRLCPNYLVSEHALLFTDQSLYTAHELAQMAPLFGYEVYLRLYQLNAWRAKILPNAAGLPVYQAARPGKMQRSLVKAVLEASLNTPPGAWLEAWEMARKVKRLSAQQSTSPESTFSAEVCKGHLNRHGMFSAASLRQRLENLAVEVTL